MRDTTVYLSIKGLAWLRRPELAWFNKCPARVKASNIGSVRVGYDPISPLIEEILDQFLELLIVIQKPIQLDLTQAATSSAHAAATTAHASGAKLAHLQLHLLLKLLETCFLEHLELFLQILFLFLELVEVGIRLRISLEEANHEVVNFVQLIFSEDPAGLLQSWHISSVFSSRFQPTPYFFFSEALVPLYWLLMVRFDQHSLNFHLVL